MNRKTTPLPSEEELAVLNVLWKLKRATSKEIRTSLADEQSQDVVRILDDMVGKQLLKAVEGSKPKTYVPAVGKLKTYYRLTQDMADRLYGGSFRKLVQHSLDRQRANPEERAKVDDLISDLRDIE
ncbi:MAG: putative transcriptional regulator [Phycisphaerales bacterium]|nr:putative transcriptional regulator [Phycisphaerales bacterium]